MYITCLDVEGVLVPEIWIAFAEASGIPELKRTTRDEPDYDKLMNWRLGILKEHGLGLKEIQETIAKIDPLPGAKEFLDVKALQSMGFDTIASGDSYNDLGMIQASKAGFLFRSTEQIRADHPEIPAYEEYDELLAAIREAMK